MKQLLDQPEYSFLKTDKHLGDNIILLGFGGSYAYGTNNEFSDIDLRGVALNSANDILSDNKFEQIVHNEQDVTVYSFDKIIKLLCNCNPNVIEMLGLREQDYLILKDEGRLLLDNKSLFLSQRAVNSFGGYANAQLRRLENKSARLVDQAGMENHILQTICHASYDFASRYSEFPDDAIRLYLDKSDRPEYDKEIFMDINLHHYPLRDYKGMMSEMGEIMKNYSKIGKRNTQAIEHDKLGKHMMHLIRLYLMCFDILEKGEIITYREKEHDFLMSIRNGAYLDDNRQPTPEFYEIVDEYQNKLNLLKLYTHLPKDVDRKKINALVAEVNMGVILDDDELLQNYMYGGTL